MTDETEYELMGEYEIPDARRLLADLEKAQIPFEIDPVDLRTHVPSKGAGGRYTRLQVWIRPTDREAADAVQARSLKIEL